MSHRHSDDAEDAAPRSYCVFERDRDLPRPTPWNPLMAERSRPKISASAITIAAAVMLGAAALAWWFVD